MAAAAIKHIVQAVESFRCWDKAWVTLLQTCFQSRPSQLLSKASSTTNHCVFEIPKESFDSKPVNKPSGAAPKQTAHYGHAVPASCSRE